MNKVRNFQTKRTKEGKDFINPDSNSLLFQKRKRGFVFQGWKRYEEAEEEE